MVLLNLPDQYLLIDIKESDWFLAEVENQCSVLLDLMWHLTSKHHLVVLYPDEQFGSDILEQTEFFDLLLQWLSPVLCIIEHIDRALDFLTYPVDHLHVYCGFLASFVFWRVLLAWRFQPFLLNFGLALLVEVIVLEDWVVRVFLLLFGDEGVSLWKFGGGVRLLHDEVSYK